MENAFKQCLWKNFGAAIDMLSGAIALCPDEQWHLTGYRMRIDKTRLIVYHDHITPCVFIGRHPDQLFLLQGSLFGAFQYEQEIQKKIRNHADGYCRVCFAGMD